MVLRFSAFRLISMSSRSVRQALAPGVVNLTAKSGAALSNHGRSLPRRVIIGIVSDA